MRVEPRKTEPDPQPFVPCSTAGDGRLFLFLGIKNLSERGVFTMEKTMDKIVALAKNRGFVYAGSEIYGGLSNNWD